MCRLLQVWMKKKRENTTNYVLEVPETHLDFLLYVCNCAPEVLKFEEKNRITQRCECVSTCTNIFSWNSASFITVYSIAWCPTGVGHWLCWVVKRSSYNTLLNRSALQEVTLQLHPLAPIYAHTPPTHAHERTHIRTPSTHRIREVHTGLLWEHILPGQSNYLNVITCAHTRLMAIPI